MGSFSQLIRQIWPEQFAWQVWSLIAGISGLLLLITCILDTQWGRADAPAKRSSRKQPLLHLIDGLSLLALTMAIAAALSLPPFQVADPLRATLFACGCMMIIAILTFFSPLQRSVRQLRWGARVLTPFKVLATASALLAILSLPLELVSQRNWILMNFVFCGGLTLYRESRRRRRSGDRAWASRLGGLLVVVQFLSLVSLVAVPLTLLVIVLLAITGLLQGRDLVAVWLGTVVFLLSLISAGYLLVYGARRLMGARGFSWIDPPNWRVALPHVKYLLSWKKTFPFIGMESTLADRIREAYIKAIAGDGRVATNAEIAAAARIELPVSPGAHDKVTFAVIGDPGEGDDSELYPGNTYRGACKRMAGQVIQSGSTNSVSSLDGEPDRSLDFVLISSDVIYPAGEMMDYERGVYRPYTRSGRESGAGAPVPIYAIPGNHDWYDNLRGFFANFTYAASASGDRRWQRRLKDMPWDWRPWRKWIWKEVDALRKDYGLETLGGLPEDPKTQQRLSFLEIEVPGVPLTVLGLDNGVTGSIDSLQYAWLANRLARARREDRLILVLLGCPLFVNGEFAGQKEAPANEVAGQRWSYGLREIYELLRKYRVDVVMGGDTHAYQRYQVTFQDSDGAHTMHHIVNGGGGAYLSCPMDVGWVDFNWQQNPRLKLSRRVVYQARSRRGRDTDVGADDVRLMDIFPTIDDMMQKFVLNDDTPPKGWLDKQRARFRKGYNSWMLHNGFTNALDHDNEPLLQSYVIVEMDQIAPRRWELRVVPWFSTGDSSQPKAQRERQLTLQFEQKTGSAAEPPEPATPLDPRSDAGRHAVSLV